MAITYRGERFSGYNKPKRTSGKSKKFAVLAKSFRARHKCDTNPPDKLSARYWSCKKW